MKMKCLAAVLILSGLFVVANEAYGWPTSPIVILIAYPADYVVLGNSVILDGSYSYDPNGSGGINGIVKFEWDFGDGTYYTETEEYHPDGDFDGITRHTYSSLGTYDVNLTVTDDRGATDDLDTPLMVTVVGDGIAGG